MNRYRLLASFVLLGAAIWLAADHRSAAAEFAVQQETDRVIITDGSQPVATYVFRDDKILRPYFANVHAPGGIQVTRHHPPVPDVDATDHDTMHPGVWLAFGDMSGQDFWRNKARVVHERFVERPAVRDGQVSFTAENTFQAANGEEVCKQTSHLTLTARPAGYLLIWEAVFRSAQREIVFGDQEEMGLGVRVATPIAVRQGGTILDAAGRRNEREVWGNTADWCDYSGIIAGRHAGITTMCDPGNFRPSWLHARDYGALVVNPFGQQAFHKGPASKVVVKPGESFRLRYGVLLHAGPPDSAPDLKAAYADFVDYGLCCATTRATQPAPTAADGGGDDRVRVLLIGHQPDHPPGTHLYLDECELLAKCLRQSPNVEAIVSDGWPQDAAQLQGVDAIVLYSSPGADLLLKGEHAETVAKMLKEGVGLVALHWATGVQGQQESELGERYLRELGGLFCFAFSELDTCESKVEQLQPDHPVCRGWQDFVLTDEFYLNLKFLPDAKPLLKVSVKGQDHVVGWVYERPDGHGGRSYGNVLGHYHELFQQESFRRMLVNGILWAARCEVPAQGAPCALTTTDVKAK